MKVELGGFEVEYFESFYAQAEADELLRGLLDVPTTPEVVKLYGKTHVTKRRSMQYGRDYDYNPTAKKAEEWTPLMRAIKTRMETAAGALDGGLVQVYPSGEAGIGWHEDKGKPEIVASLSLCAEREFCFGQMEGKGCTEISGCALSTARCCLFPPQLTELTSTVSPSKEDHGAENQCHAQEIPSMNKAINISSHEF